MSKLSGGWRRYMVVGCSHGHLQDDDAIKQVLKFKRLWKPHRVIHLGDFIDTAAFRSGASGTADEAVELKGDLGHGLNFLRALEPTDVLIGNHEVRLYNAAQHYNAVKAYAAQAMIDETRNLLRSMKTQYIETYDINRSWITLGDTKFLHGWVYSEDAIKQHAEHYGKVVLAHLHRPGIEPGRRSDNPVGHCVGFLADRDKLGYATARRSTARWALGFGYGEYRDGDCQVNISSCKSGDALNWRLPV